MVVNTIINTIPQNPIFIVGFPRSGTTLLQSMLATQDNIYSFQETHFFCTTKRYIDVDDYGFILPHCLKFVFPNIKEKTEYSFSSELELEIKSLADNRQLTIKLLFEYLVRGLLLEQIEKDQLSYIQWIEKTPGHIFQLDFISNLYPKARFIYIVRNPLNAIHSCKTKFEDIDHLTPCNLAHRWKRSFNTFMKFKNSKIDKSYLIKYENLANDTEHEFVKICKFLNIVFDINKLQNIQKTAKQLVLKKEPWKNNNLSKGIIKNGFDYKWLFNEKLKIRYLLRKELFELDYLNGYSLSQKVYNHWMSGVNKLSKIKSLNIFKTPIKYFVKSLGLWPYHK
jgi:hypothetical protein